MVRYFLIALLVLLPNVAFAGTWTFGCGQPIDSAGHTTPTPTKTTINGTELACYDILSAENTTNGDSGLFTIFSKSAIICYDPDTTSTATDSSRVLIRRCNALVKDSTKPSSAENVCFTMGGAQNDSISLSGVEGARNLQNGCDVYLPGTYYIDLTAACSSNHCEVSIHGNGN